MAKKASPKSPGAKQRISAKIKHLKAEGTPQQQAIATALSMERAHRLTAGGGYKRVKKGKKK